VATLTVSKARARRHKRVRGKVSGTAERPRLVVTRSNRGIVAQLVDDMEGRTLASATWLQVKKTF
jgi:large subunit ribosomal protein L18